MKNIYLMPTNQPSFGKYLVLNKEGKLCIWDTNVMGSQTTLPAQHIYITSDEEGKKGDWLVKIHFINKKTILTTDQKLIADGVQAIDDEFLEWFVKNPDCEEVKIESHVYKGKFLATHYEIIIPKEEPKQDKTWLLLPMLAYSKYSNGTQEVSFGWLNQTFFIKF